jgi:hypothetical protein
MDLGFGFVKRTLSCFLAKRRIMICDNSVDLGFDLHRHVDALLLPRLVPDRTALLQLSGRISRIAVDIKDQGTIRILSNMYEGTLDELFLKHVQQEQKYKPRPTTTTRSSLSDSMIQEIISRLEHNDLARQWFGTIIQQAKRARLI